MNVCGIVAEYNPLHNGHQFHLSQARALTGSQYVVVVMSGSFTQRGEPAIFDKWARTRWALACGADLVIELPVLYSLQSAEHFAHGAVKLLANLGVVTHLCFGCELADAALLTQAARFIENEPPAFRAALSRVLKSGCSYPRARFEALREIGAPERMLELLSEPNGILGVEYIRAIERYSPNMAVAPLPRIAVGHHATEASGGFASATMIRRQIALGHPVDPLVPAYVWEDMVELIANGDGPVFMEQLDPILLYILRSTPSQSFLELSDAVEGLDNALCSAAIGCGSSEALLNALKSKRYTHARLSRLLSHALLSIRKSDLMVANKHDSPGYIRILGMRARAQEVLSEIKQKASWPLVSRKAEMDTLKGRATEILRFDRAATDMHALGKAPAQRRANQDYTRKVIVV